ncbi:unnamed protein product [Adineta ricciae]|uniref:Uncharacterized protein n=1 Tax=Adineta ricciae TaxID=249248 RepID=A0A815FF29_ADIRI|nr:unnamed protein product [Adineta ricciae]CAF1324560.1 unnamed protein product [Adineta ricciae]
MATANFRFNAKDQQPIIDLLRARDAAQLQDKPGRVDVNPVKSHVKFLMGKLFMIIFLFIVAIIGLASLVIGVIGFNKRCYLPRQPSIPIWLIVLGGSSIILVVALVTLILVATVIKYNTSEKAFRRAFIVIVGIGGGVLSWSVGPGSNAIFRLPQSSGDCLGFVLTYCTAIYVILCICSIVYSIYCAYKFWKRCCTRKRNNKATVVPVQPTDTPQDAAEPSDVPKDIVEPSDAPKDAVEPSDVPKDIVEPSDAPKDEPGSAEVSVCDETSTDLPPLKKIPKKLDTTLHADSSIASSD